MLAHVRSDEAGKFSIQSLKPKTKVMLLGIAEREDEPAYYAYTSLKIEPGRNSAKLDFDRGDTCTKQ